MCLGQGVTAGARAACPGLPPPHPPLHATWCSEVLHKDRANLEALWRRHEQVLCHVCLPRKLHTHHRKWQSEVSMEQRKCGRWQKEVGSWPCGRRHIRLATLRVMEVWQWKCSSPLGENPGHTYGLGIHSFASAKSTWASCCKEHTPSHSWAGSSHRRRAMPSRGAPGVSEAASSRSAGHRQAGGGGGATGPRLGAISASQSSFRFL